jgi:hypothetical protein
MGTTLRYPLPRLVQVLALFSDPCKNLVDLHLDREYKLLEPIFGHAQFVYRPAAR